jgi:hypothetical protein
VRNCGENGISGGNDGVVRDCLAEGNDGNGILIRQPGHVLRGITNDNGGDGIDVGIGSVVLDCTTGFGGNRITGNVSFSSITANCQIAPNNFEGARVSSPLNVPNADPWANFSD